MQTVLIVIHLLIVLALVGVVLIQRSEGGGLGIGGGGGGLMTARGAANALTRMTAILGAGFFATSLILGIMAMHGERPTDILNRIPTTSGTTAPAGSTGGNGILNQLGGGTTAPDAPAAPAAPASSVPSSQ